MRVGCHSARAPLNGRPRPAAEEAQCAAQTPESKQVAPANSHRQLIPPKATPSTNTSAYAAPPPNAMNLMRGARCEPLRNR